MLRMESEEVSRPTAPRTRPPEQPFRKLPVLAKQLTCFNRQQYKYTPHSVPWLTRPARKTSRFYISSGLDIELYYSQRCGSFLHTRRVFECTPGEVGSSVPAPRGLSPCCRRHRGRTGRSSAGRTGTASPKKWVCFVNGRPADPRSCGRSRWRKGMPPPPSWAGASITTITMRRSEERRV